MRLNVERDHDIGYLALTDDDERPKAAHSLTVEPPGGKSELHLDFDADGLLLGIEFMWPSRQLRPSTLAKAEFYR